MPSARAAHASTQGQEEREDADSPKTPRSKGILAQLQTELRQGPPPGDNKEEEDLRRALLASVVPLSFECQAESSTAVGDRNTAGSHDSWSVVDGPSVAHGFDERPGQSPAPVDAEDSAPFRAPADEESEEEGPMVEIDWDATWKLRKEIAKKRQRQQQQQGAPRGAPWALKKVTATRYTRSGVTRTTIEQMRRINALNLEPRGEKKPLCRFVDGFGKGPQGP